MRYTYMAAFSLEDEGGYSVSVPDLPGCYSFGASLEQAIDMIAEAMGLWIETNILEGWDIPEPSAEIECDNTLRTVAVSVEVNPKFGEYQDPFITVKEAAATLGVTTGRIHQLIRAEVLLSEKRGRDMFVERMSVEERLASKPRSGRPASNEAVEEVVTTQNIESSQSLIYGSVYEPDAYSVWLPGSAIMAQASFDLRAVNNAFSLAA